MEVTGKIKAIGETATFGSSNFRKREVAITTEEQFPQTIAIEFVQDKCDVLNGYKVGESVKIGINLRGREWVNPQGETKYFNSIQGWNISRVGAVNPTPPPTGYVVSASQSNEDPDDLPF